MATCGLKVHIKRKWWVMPFTHLLTGIYRATGWSPDPQKLGSFLSKYGFIYSLRQTEEC